jgi:hypothetical protein
MRRTYIQADATMGTRPEHAQLDHEPALAWESPHEASSQSGAA